MSVWDSVSREAIAGAQTDDPFLDTLHLSHPDTATEFFLVNDFNDQTFTLEDTTVQLFTRGGFIVKAPTIASDGVQTMDLQIDTTNLAIVDFLREVRESKNVFKVVYRQYQLSRPEQPARGPITMSMTSFVIDIHLVRTKAFTRDIVNAALLSEKYTILSNPGLK